jgi:hypothetical protein
MWRLVTEGRYGYVYASLGILSIVTLAKNRLYAALDMRRQLCLPGDTGT